MNPNNIFNKIGLTAETNQLINAYVEKQEEALDQGLITDDKAPRFIRNSESKLPFSIEYWGDKTFIVHTKTIRANGSNKYIYYSADIQNRRLYARAKTLNGEIAKVEREAKVIDLFVGCRGIIQNVCSSHYLDKNQSNLKFHMIQELYEGTFDHLLTKKLTDKQLQVITLDLISGLEAIHAKGVVHDDIKAANILYQINDEGMVIKSVLCDLGEVTDISKRIFTGKLTLEETQATEVNQLVLLLIRLYKSQAKPVPEIFQKLRTIYEDNPWDLEPRNAASAKDAAVALKSYYKNF